MIKLTRLNGQELFINIDNIEFIEEAPHTIITTTAGNKFITRETAVEIVELVLNYKRRLLANENIVEGSGD